MLGSMKNDILTGYWWLPEDEDKYYSGTLYLDSSDGIRLELQGSFRTFNTLNKEIKYTIILGICDNEHITLFGCFEKSYSFGSGIPKQIFLINECYNGFHFKKEEDIRFDKLSFSFPHLFDWLSITGINVQHKMNDKGHLEKIVANYIPTSKIKYVLNDFTFSVLFKFYTNIGKFHLFKIEEYPYLSVEINEPISFRNIWNSYIKCIQHLFSLIYRRHISPIDIIGNNRSIFHKSHTGTKYPIDIKVFLSYSRPTQDISKTILPYQFLFVYKDIKNDFGQILENWFNCNKNIKQVINLYFSTISNTDMYLDTKFLYLTQALESYHRLKFEGKYISDDDFLNVFTVLSEAIPKSLKKEFRNSIINRINYLNEYSLSKRLKEIINNCEPYIDEYISNKKSFVRKVTDTRNYLTHYDHKLKAKSSSGKELYKLCLGLQLLFEIIFLKEIDIKKEINIILKKHSEYKSLAIIP